MKTLAGFGKGKKIHIYFKNFLVLKRASLSNQAAVLGWWGLNQKLQLAMAFPSLASQPGSVCSVIKRCCLAVLDLDLLPVLVAVNNSQKLLFDTARQSHCPSSYTRDRVPCAPPRALAFAVHPWYPGLNPGCADFLSRVLCAAVAPLEGCLYVGKGVFPQGSCSALCGMFAGQNRAAQNLPLWWQDGLVSNDLPLRTGHGWGWGIPSAWEGPDLKTR